jgi:hypothetical protein
MLLVVSGQEPPRRAWAAVGGMQGADVHAGQDEQPTQQQRAGQGEAEAGAPQGSKLAVAEPDGDPVAAGEQDPSDEAGERHPLTANATPRQSRFPPLHQAKPGERRFCRMGADATNAATRSGRKRLRASHLTRLIIQTTRWDPSGADQIDAQHQTTDLAVGGSNPSRRQTCSSEAIKQGKPQRGFLAGQDRLEVLGHVVPGWNLVVAAG